MGTKTENYLRDLGILLTEYANEAIQDNLRSRESIGCDFKAGYMMGFHRVITLMQQQADAFGLSYDEIGLSKISEGDFLK